MIPKTTNRQTLRLPARRRARFQAAPLLRFTPYAWAKLLFLRDLGPTEVGGFGISAADDLLLVEDLVLIRQICSEVTVRFDDGAVADFFDHQVDLGRRPEQFARIWIHTHPGSSPSPSSTDEATFDRCFGPADWALMFIVARGGRTYARLRFQAGPSSELTLPAEVDFSHPFPATAAREWEQDYDRCVAVDVHSSLRLHLSKVPVSLSGDAGAGNPSAAVDRELDWASLLWPPESLHDRFF